MWRTGGSRLLATVLSAMMAALFLCGPGAFGAEASSESAEAEFLALVNQERVARGLGRLVEAADLVAVARRHSARMADRDEVFHNANLSSEVEGWQLVGENVGIGPTVRETHDALMESKVHRDVLLQPRFTQLGVGVVLKGPDIWLTQVFRLPEGQPESTVTTAPPAVATASTASTSSTPARRPATALGRLQVAGGRPGSPATEEPASPAVPVPGAAEAPPDPPTAPLEPVDIDDINPQAVSVPLPKRADIPEAGLVAAALLLLVVGSASVTTRRVVVN
ncbi:MAG TPA: CAP domain-containing protein [Acidimicrobiales bacterium]|nr:CAP domain-containing protein [Acidimicrobiales bacterium]